MKLKYEVKEEECIIKQILKSKFHLSKRLIKKLKDNKKIIRNGESVSVNVLVNCGDVIEVNLEFEEECENIVATNILLDIVYEDDAYIVINKQPKIETHPTCANYANTLANGLKYYFEQNNIKRKIRPVNRLDKETSGLIIFAKSEYVQEQLVRQMKEGTFKKEYIAIVEGVLEQESGEIDMPIKRKEGSILERCVAEDGEIAITDYKVIKRLQDKTVVKCYLKTGRTHQIRVHMKYLGHPIVSDFLYGNLYEKSIYDKNISENEYKNNIEKNLDKLIDRQALHSYRIEFIHPITNEKVEYIQEIPHDMQYILENYCSTCNKSF